MKTELSSYNHYNQVKEGIQWTICSMKKNQIGFLHAIAREYQRKLKIKN